MRCLLNITTCQHEICEVTLGPLIELPHLNVKLPKKEVVLVTVLIQ